MLRNRRGEVSVQSALAIYPPLAPLGPPSGKVDWARALLLQKAQSKENAIARKLRLAYCDRSTAIDVGDASCKRGLYLPRLARNALAPGNHWIPKNASTVPVSLGIIMFVSP